MFTPDFTKFFDPNQYTQNMQKFFDWSNTASTSKQNIECIKQVNNIVTDTIASCTEKQFKFAQATMQDCVETMRELSTSKGIEDYMSKQAEIAKRSAEKAQSMAQEIATCWQTSQTKCSDIISQQLTQNVEWSKTATNSAINTATKAANNATSTSSK